jgi:tetratricopeptide (TPR) repeat protein
MAENTVNPMQNAALPNLIHIKKMPNQDPKKVLFSVAWQATDNLLKNNNHIVAAYMLRQMSDQAPGSHLPLVRLLTVCRDFMRLDEAEDIAQEALRKFPSNMQVLVAVAKFHHVNEAPEEAIKYLEKSLAIAPTHLVSLHLMVAIYQALGDSSKTQEYLERAQQVAPDDPNIIFAAARNQKERASSAFKSRVESLANSGKYTGRLQSYLHYSMAWLHESDLNIHFGHLHKANAIIAQMYPWDQKSTEAVAQRNQKVFTETAVKPLRGAGDLELQPIFIAAMPRSGTTLLEQMIGAHSKVHCVGERAAFDIKLQSTIHTGNPLPITQNLEEVKDFEQAIQEVFEAYKNSRQVGRAGSKRVVDKSIGNWNAVGMICLAFPNARVIHLERHPLDIIYSCYQQLFDTGHFYANNLVWLAEMYKIYRRQMEDWKRLFPDNIYTLYYENLVNNQEEELIGVLQFCGLDWEDACLNYRDGMGSITTASDRQVREPLYTKSAYKWRAARHHLAEAVERLDDTENYNP